MLPLVFFTFLAGAAPTPDPITGRYYKEETATRTWDDARTNAAAQVFAGETGHLVIIGTVRENLIVQHLGGTAERWIGLTDSTATSTLDGFDFSLLGTSESGNSSGQPLPEAGTAPVTGERGFGFQWITGDPYTFLNWRAGTPSGSPSGSDGVYAITQGVWQDAAAGPSLGEGGFVLRKSIVEYDVLLDQERFLVTERKAAASFNGNGSVPNLAAAELLMALPQGHSDIAAEATNRAYVISFHDPDLGGGVNTVVRAPILLDAVGVNENDIVFRASTQVMIPAAGQWTFGVGCGDAFRLRVGGNEFVGTGILPTAPPRLTLPGEGTLSAAPGGSGDTFYFPEAGVYPLFITALDSGFFAFVQLFAAPGHQTSFDAATFDLVGDELNGGLQLTCQAGVSGSLVISGELLPDGGFRIQWNSSPCGRYRLDFSEDLISWEPAIAGIHPAASVTGIDHSPDTPQGFYRVVEEQ